MNTISTRAAASARSRWFAAFLCALTPAAAPLQAADAKPVNELEPAAIKLRDAAMRGDSIAWDFVSELTTRFGPRPAGAASEHAAAAWVARKLKAYGFEKIRIEEFPITAWVRGEEHGEISAPSPQPISIASLGHAPPTPSSGLDGEVALFETLNDLTAVPTGGLAGKIVMINQRTVRAQDGAGYGITARTRAIGPVEAARRGAVAFVLRSVGTDNHRMPHTGTTRYFDGKVPIPAFALSAPDADQIQRLIGYGEKVRLRLFSRASYVTDAHSQNVVAEIRGSDKADEVIVLGAHLDSWDLGTGAIDDAAGCAIVTAAAKLIGDLPGRPRRTVRVVLFGSEEVAQPDEKPLGGPSYVLAHKAEIAKHVITGESDFGADRVYGVALPPQAMNSPFGLSLMRVLTPIGVLPSKVSPERGGTDVGPMADAGVPAFLLLQDGTRYFDIHHTADDTLDKIDRAQLDQNVAAWVSLAYLAAQSDVDFRALANQAEQKQVDPKAQ